MQLEAIRVLKRGVIVPVYKAGGKILYILTVMGASPSLP